MHSYEPAEPPYADLDPDTEVADLPPLDHHLAEVHFALRHMIGYDDKTFRAANHLLNIAADKLASRRKSKHSTLDQEVGDLFQHLADICYHLAHAFREVMPHYVPDEDSYEEYPEDDPRYLAERDAALLSLDRARITGFKCKYDQLYHLDWHAFWTAVHRERLCTPTLPVEAREQSRLWLQSEILCSENGSWHSPPTS